MLRLNEKGFGLIQVLFLGTLLALMSLHYSSRSIVFQKDMNRLRAKDQIVTDRKLIEFDLVNRKFPAGLP
ncbi:MAG: hypothetical protein H7333_04320 [Bdellovibrionales bacterium]|nr:hypothetical protein [Oligoflexia bacterium]